MTFREWTKAYGGTYSTVLLVAMMVSIVVANEYAQDSLWMYLVVMTSQVVQPGDGRDSADG